MMSGSDVSFPCREQPTKCRFLYNHTQRLGSGPRGAVALSQQFRLQWDEEWYLIPSGVEGANAFYIRSVQHGFFLKSNPAGEVSTSHHSAVHGGSSATAREQSDDYMDPTISNNNSLALREFNDNGNSNQVGCMYSSGELWSIVACPTTATTAGCVQVISVAHLQTLTVDAVTKTVRTEKSNANTASNWSIQFTSGELCFVTNGRHKKRLRSNLVGNLSVSDKRSSWEVWRFIEAGGRGELQISSWSHASQFLTCDDGGKISVSRPTKKRTFVEEWTRWTVVKGSQGILIQSVAHAQNYFLAFDGLQLFGTGNANDPSIVWDLEAAHSNEFFLQCQDKKLASCAGATGDGSSVNERKWKVMKGQDHRFTIQSCFDRTL
jgi:hypothetical protein